LKFYKNFPPLQFPLPDQFFPVCVKRPQWLKDLEIVQKIPCHKLSNSFFFSFSGPVHRQVLESDVD